MKKPFFLLLLPLCLGALAACNEEQDVSSAYFNGLGDSVLSASKATSFRAYSDSTHLAAGIILESEGRQQKVGVELAPLCFDLRMDNILEGTVGTIKASFDGKNTKPTHLVLQGALGGNMKTEFDVAPSIYVEKGVLYADLTNATVLRTMINTYFKDHLKSDFPFKGKLTTGLPSNLGYDVPDFDRDAFVKKMIECYDVAKTAFSFAEEDGVSTITFASTDPTQLGLILEAMLGKKEDPLVSAYETTEGKYTLNSFAFDLAYTRFGPASIRFDVGVDFRDDAFSSFKPDGEWKIDGKISFAYGETAKAKTVVDPDSYQEVNLSVVVG